MRIHFLYLPVEYKASVSGRILRISIQPDEKPEYSFICQAHLKGFHIQNPALPAHSVVSPCPDCSISARRKSEHMRAYCFAKHGFIILFPILYIVIR